MLKIRRPLGRLIFNMGIAIPGKTVFLIETAPRSSAVIAFIDLEYSVLSMRSKKCIAGLAQDCGISVTNALEKSQSCAKPLDMLRDYCRTSWSHFQCRDNILPIYEFPLYSRPSHLYNENPYYLERPSYLKQCRCGRLSTRINCVLPIQAPSAHTTDIFTLPSRYLKPNERVFCAHTVSHDPFYHVVATNYSLLLMDQRMPNYPVSWGCCDSL